MAVVDVNEAKAQETVAELRSKGVRSIAIKADITQAKECQRCASPPYSSVSHSGVLFVHLSCNGLCHRQLQQIAVCPFLLHLGCLNFTLNIAGWWRLPSQIWVACTLPLTTPA